MAGVEIETETTGFLESEFRGKMFDWFLTLNRIRQNNTHRLYQLCTMTVRFTIFTLINQFIFYFFYNLSIRAKKKNYLTVIGTLINWWCTA